MQVQSEQEAPSEEADGGMEDSVIFGRAAGEETARLLKGTLQTVMRVNKLVKAETTQHRELLSELKRCESARVAANLKMGHRERLIDGIRQIDTLVGTCRDYAGLLTDACKTLVECSEYRCAWALWKQADGSPHVAHEGQSDWGKLLQEKARAGRLPQCVAHAFSRREPQVMREHSSECASCGLSDECPGATILVSCMHGSGGWICGALGVSTQRPRTPDEYELYLLSHLARYLAISWNSAEPQPGEERKDPSALSGEQVECPDLSEDTRGVQCRDGQGSEPESIPTDTVVSTNAVGVQKGSENARGGPARTGPSRQLRQSQKMEAIGQLAGGVAHDFNNLLVVISGYARMAREKLEADSAPRKDIDEVVDAADRASKLTRQLLAFSRRQTMHPELLDLNELIERTFRMLKRLIGEHIRLEFRPADRPARVKADANQMEQVLLNLVVNARDAMPEGGNLTIRTETEHRGRDCVRLSVIDTGRGMDAATQRHIFKPFFTTKEQKGTGLGLATVRSIVRHHGGRVRVNSKTNEGTAVHVLLPLQAHEGSGDREPEEYREHGRADAHILLVEDEEIVRELSRRVLEANGYTVDDVESPEEARERFERSGGSVDLLVTDVVMPGQDGAKLYASLAEQDPSLRVLYISGYRPDGALPAEVSESDASFLRKPFTPESLTEKVRETLGQTAGAR